MSKLNAHLRNTTFVLDQLLTREERWRDPLFAKVMKDIRELALLPGNPEMSEIDKKLQDIKYSIEHLILEARESNDR